MAIDYAHPNEYRPKVCGDCKSFEIMGERRNETNGRLPGICRKLWCDTSRTDWCHDPNEESQRRQAMKAYRGERDD